MSLVRDICIEEYRSNKLDELRLLYNSLCANLGIPEPRNSFNRWLLENGTRCTVDVLIPTNPDMTSIVNEINEDVPIKLFSGGSEGYVHNSIRPYVEASKKLFTKYNQEYDKQLDSITVENFQTTREIVDPILRGLIASDLKTLCDALSRKSNEFALTVKNSSNPNNCKANVKLIKLGPNIILVNQMTVVLHNTVYETLRFKHKGKNVDADIYRLNLRYKSLSKDEEGLQIAVSQEVFRRLSVLGVTGECFASPFNSTLSTYWSAFVDTDTVFGSRGSFFSKQKVPSGFYEANPPFAEDFMMRMVLRLEFLLSIKNVPMSFICFVPNWEDSQAIQALSKSRYVTRLMTFNKYEALFSRRGSPFALPNGTLVCVLQNSFSTWAVPPVEELKEYLLGIRNLLLF